MRKEVQLIIRSIKYVYFKRVDHFKEVKRPQSARKIEIPVNTPLMLFNGPELQLFPEQHVSVELKVHPVIEVGQEG